MKKKRSNQQNRRPTISIRKKNNYEIYLLSNTSEQQEEIGYFLTGLEKTDPLRCVLAYDKELNQVTFYMVQSYYKTDPAVDLLSGRKILGKNTTVIEEFEFSESVMSGNIDFTMGSQ